MKENGKSGLSVKVRGWFQKLEKAGAPIWWRKIHGSQYQRDMPDYLWMIRHGLPSAQWPPKPTIAGAIELKNPENPTPPTPKQLQELGRMRIAGGATLVSHDLLEVQRYISRILASVGWSHPTLTAPYLDD
jgi:hypothetical protein